MALTIYEIIRRSCDPLLPPLNRKVRSRALREAKASDRRLSILDVGGRKSPYTIGLPADVTIIDLPRETEVQRDLNLGVNEQIADELKKRRSNIHSVIFGDMTCSDLPSASYDVVIAVEVLEHVLEDAKFVSEVSRVLIPGGKFIMTTPNGDFVENRNPDHKRHYKKAQLAGLLSEYFENVEVEYAIAGGYYRKIGLRSWSLKRPQQTALSIFGNIVNSIQSADKGIAERALGTHHLIAVAYNPYGEVAVDESEPSRMRAAEKRNT